MEEFADRAECPDKTSCDPSRRIFLWPKGMHLYICSAKMTDPGDSESFTRHSCSRLAAWKVYARRMQQCCCTSDTVDLRGIDVFVGFGLWYDVIGSQPLCLLEALSSERFWIVMVV